MIAVVDDDPEVLDSFRFLLELSGYEVAIYSSAVAFLADDFDRLSCLILDHHMPQMSGLQLAAKLRAQGSSLPILLITGSSAPALDAQATRVGIDKVLEKPVGEEDLMQFVTAHL